MRLKTHQRRRSKPVEQVRAKHRTVLRMTAGLWPIHKQTRIVESIGRHTCMVLSFSKSTQKLKYWAVSNHLLASNKRTLSVMFEYLSPLTSTGPYPVLYRSQDLEILQLRFTLNHYTYKPLSLVFIGFPLLTTPVLNPDWEIGHLKVQVPGLPTLQTLYLWKLGPIRYLC